jgi:hypothetical protein
MASYDAYVLRFWRSAGKDGPQWKAGVEHLGQGESARFDDLEALLRYIRDVAGGASDRRAVEEKQMKGSVLPPRVVEHAIGQIVLQLHGKAAVDDQGMAGDER